MAVSGEIGQIGEGFQQGVAGPRSGWWRGAHIWAFRLFYLAGFALVAMVVAIVACIELHMTGVSILQIATMVLYAAYAMCVLGGAGIISAVFYSDAYAREVRAVRPGATDNEIQAALTAASAQNMRACLGLGR